MSPYWGPRGTGWRPQGGTEKPWRDLAPGDLVALKRQIWRVIGVRQKPVIDWDEQDRAYYSAYCAGRFSEEDWPKRPLDLIIAPAAGGKRRHVKLCPYTSLFDAWVLSPHYPVCHDCGEPWPCRELDIADAVARDAAKLARLEKIGPGCCWSCGESITHRQGVIAFDGENLLFPGAPPPAFHLRRKGQCLSDAFTYEEKWVPAAEGRRWRLQCPGRLTRHVDGNECSNDPHCPGVKAMHRTVTCHYYTRSGDVCRLIEGYECLRCEDSLARGDFLGSPPPGAML